MPMQKSQQYYTRIVCELGKKPCLASCGMLEARCTEPYNPRVLNEGSKVDLRAVSERATLRVS